MLGVIRRVVCLPGFGDPIVGARWVGDLAAQLGCDYEVVALDWPGCWTRCGEQISFLRLVEEAKKLSGPDTVLVGHSLGGRVAVQLANQGVALAGVVALCAPPILGVNAAHAAAIWRSTGSRVTNRRAANGRRCSLHLPVVFLDELDAWLAPSALPDLVPTLLVFGDVDSKASRPSWGPSVGNVATLTVPGCGHRFMDVAMHRAIVVAATTAFIANL